MNYKDIYNDLVIKTNGFTDDSGYYDIDTKPEMQIALDILKDAYSNVERAGLDYDTRDPNGKKYRIEFSTPILEEQFLYEAYNMNESLLNESVQYPYAFFNGNRCLNRVAITKESAYKYWKEVLSKHTNVSPKDIKLIELYNISDKLLNENNLCIGLIGNTYIVGNSRDEVEDYFGYNNRGRFCQILTTKATLVDYNEKVITNMDEAMIEKHDQLNPKLWDKNNELRPEVKEKLNEIVNKFEDNLKDNEVDLDIEDVCIIGSNASYNYNDTSDIDLHIIADTSIYSDEDLALKTYLAYKSLFNDKYDPTVRGIDVEVYVEPHEVHANSKGIYSLNNGWLKEPEAMDIPEVDEAEIDKLSEPYKERAEEVETIEDVDKLIDDIYLQRQQSIQKDGEFGKGNLIFKLLRSLGILQDLKDKKVELENKEMSIEESGMEDKFNENLEKYFIEEALNEDAIEGYFELLPGQLYELAPGHKMAIKDVVDDGSVVLGAEIFEDDEYEFLEDYKHIQAMLYEYDAKLVDGPEAVVKTEESITEEAEEVQNGFIFRFPDVRDTLQVYLDWEGIYGYTDDIIEFGMAPESDALENYLAEEGIFGYTYAINNILDGESAFCRDMTREDFEDICRSEYIDPSLADGDFEEAYSVKKKNIENGEDKVIEIDRVDNGDLAQTIADENDGWVEKVDESINLPAYAVEFLSGYAGYGVNRVETKYFRTKEEQEQFVKELEENGAQGVKTYTIDNFYHTEVDESLTEGADDKVYHLMIGYGDDEWDEGEEEFSSKSLENIINFLRNNDEGYYVPDKDKLVNALVNIGDEYFDDADGMYKIKVVDHYQGTNLDEQLDEDTVKKKNGKWVNKGKDGEHGEFKTKKEADAQRKAMFAGGYHESVDEGYNRLKRTFDSFEGAKKFAGFLDKDLEPMIDQFDHENDDGSVSNWYEVYYWDPESFHEDELDEAYKGKDLIFDRHTGSREVDYGINKIRFVTDNYEDAVRWNRQLNAAIARDFDNLGWPSEDEKYFDPENYPSSIQQTGDHEYSFWRDRTIVDSLPDSEFVSLDDPIEDHYYDDDELFEELSDYKIINSSTELDELDNEFPYSHIKDYIEDDGNYPKVIYQGNFDSSDGHGVNHWVELPRDEWEENGIEIQQNLFDESLNESRKHIGRYKGLDIFKSDRGELTAEDTYGMYYIVAYNLEDLKDKIDDKLYSWNQKADIIMDEAADSSRIINIKYLSDNGVSAKEIQKEFPELKFNFKGQTFEVEGNKEDINKLRQRLKVKSLDEDKKFRITLDNNRSYDTKGSNKDDVLEREYLDLQRNGFFGKITNIEELNEGALEATPGFMSPEEIRDFDRANKEKAQAEKDKLRAQKARDKKIALKAERDLAKRRALAKEVESKSYYVLADILNDVAGQTEDGHDAYDLSRNEVLQHLRSILGGDKGILKKYHELFESIDEAKYLGSCDDDKQKKKEIKDKVIKDKPKNKYDIKVDESVFDQDRITAVFDRYDLASDFYNSLDKSLNPKIKRHLDEYNDIVTYKVSYDNDKKKKNEATNVRQSYALNADSPSEAEAIVKDLESKGYYADQIQGSSIFKIIGKKNASDEVNRAVKKELGLKEEVLTEGKKEFKDNWTYENPDWRAIWDKAVETCHSNGKQGPKPHDIFQEESVKEWTKVLLKYLDDHNIGFEIVYDEYVPKSGIYQIKFNLDNGKQLDASLQSDLYGEFGNLCKAAWSYDRDHIISMSSHDINDLFKYLDRNFQRDTEINPELYKQGGHDSYDSGYINDEGPELDEGLSQDAKDALEHEFTKIALDKEDYDNLADEDIEIFVDSACNFDGHSAEDNIMSNYESAKRYIRKLAKEASELFDESLNEAVNENDPKAQALALYLDITTDGIDSNYDDGVYDVGNEEYFVGTEDESYERAKDEVKMSFDDMGLDAFTPDFQEFILDNCIDQDEVDNFVEEEIRYFTEDEPDQNMVEYLEGLVDRVQYIRDTLGDDTFKEWAKDKVDLDKLADEAIDRDGKEHFIAYYDGNEIDLGNGLFAYRLN